VQKKKEKKKENTMSPEKTMSPLFFNVNNGHGAEAEEEKKKEKEKGKGKEGEGEGKGKGRRRVGNPFSVFLQGAPLFTVL